MAAAVLAAPVVDWPGAAQELGLAQGAADQVQRAGEIADRLPPTDRPRGVDDQAVFEEGDPVQILNFTADRVDPAGRVVDAAALVGAQFIADIAQAALQIAVLLLPAAQGRDQCVDRLGCRSVDAGLIQALPDRLAVAAQGLDLGLQRARLVLDLVELRGLAAVFDQAAEKLVELLRVAAGADGLQARQHGLLQHQLLEGLIELLLGLAQLIEQALSLLGLLLGLAALVLQQDRADDQQQEEQQEHQLVEGHADQKGAPGAGVLH